LGATKPKDINRISTVAKVSYACGGEPCFDKIASQHVSPKILTTGRTILCPSCILLSGYNIPHII
jgi:hypothetical protein